MKVQFNKEQVKEWLLENLFAIVFSCIALGLIVWAQGLRDGLDEVIQQKAQKELEQGRMKSDLQTSQGIEKELKEIDEQFLKLRGNLLNFAQKTEIYRFFLEFENNTKLKLGTPLLVSAFNLSKKNTIDLEKDLKGINGNIVAAEYQISTEGDYATLLKLFQRIEQSKHFVKTKSIELKESLEAPQNNAFGIFTPVPINTEEITQEKGEPVSKKLTAIVRLIVLGEIKIDETEGV